MKFLAVAVLVYFMASFLALGVDSGVISDGTDLSISAPIEEVMVALSHGIRFPIIHSGDTIALRWAYTPSTSSSNSKKWLYCTTSYCYWYTCPGTFMTSSAWSSSCSNHMKFVIYAFGKADGEPIDSGDTVSLYGKGYGYTYRVYCSTSSSTKCTLTSTSSSWTGNSWLTYPYTTFEIYSRNADDGTPVQYGDVVGFKFPYASNSAWLYYYSSYFYAKSCSSTSKSSCAAENTNTGFVIFKMLS